MNYTMKKIVLYPIIVIICLSGLFSCNDWFELAPKYDTTVEDFWKDEKDVKSAVGACYRAMNEGGFLDRLLVWGEIRSDNVRKGVGASAENSRDVLRILDLMLNSTNQYTKWEDFYKVINYCNTVIHFAPTVLEKDPNFRPAALQSYLAEVKGIRALCYFILVRTFRDIPFLTEPVIDDTKPFDIPQSDPDEILRYLIEDLKTVENDAELDFLNIADDKGRITRKAIWSIIADMSLWLGEYDDCISYCDKVLQLLTTPIRHRLEMEKSPTEYYRRIFVYGNSSESIFELQFEPSLVRGNTPVHSMYGIREYNGYSASFSSDESRERVFTFDFIGQIPLFRTEDLRSKDFYVQTNQSERHPIVKYVGYRDPQKDIPAISDYYTTAFNSWIFYRLPDIYLMKAEALVELGGDLTEALACVSKSYDRANPDLGENSLLEQSREELRELVFKERQREFLFEGKRYFDMLRRVKRENSLTSILPLLIRRYEMDKLNSNTVRGKISDVDALYIPINEEELKTNPLLKQNPFYASTSIIKK